MLCQLITAKTNATTELLLLIDDRIVSRWPDKTTTTYIGDLRDWDNQAQAGADLSDYQADYDAGRLELDQVLAEQCDLQEFFAEFEIESLWFVSHWFFNGYEITKDIRKNLGFLGDLSCYWGRIRNTDTWDWDGSSAVRPTDQCGNKIDSLKAFAKSRD